MHISVTKQSLRFYLGINFSINRFLRWERTDSHQFLHLAKIVCRNHILVNISFFSGPVISTSWADCTGNEGKKLCA